MTKNALAWLMLGLSLCFASASFAYDRYVIGAVLIVETPPLTFHGDAKALPAMSLKSEFSLGGKG